MGQIFVYCKDAEKKEKIRQTVQQLHLEMKEFAPKNLSSRIGYLVGMTETDVKDCSVPPFYNMPEVMLFAGLSGEQLDEFLAAYKRNGIEPIYQKAVFTPYNAAWSLYQLIEELKQEHAEMNRMLKK